MSLELRVLPIDQLTPAPYNPRRGLKPTDAAYRKLQLSLREFGLVEPLVWNELTGHVVGGHARMRILRDLGYAEVPVSVVRLSPEREKALNVVLNNREAQGRFDPAKLTELLTELEELPELELTGFDAADLRAMRFEPIDTPAEDAIRFVEVTLRADPDTFARMEPALDQLVREYDLECHVNRG